ncbi:MAG: GyrI-like domain-containing protein [Anaerolineae bacterium]|nr:GyrI-like domain-containing protein [Anaerolineae bacterium]
MAKMDFKKELKHLYNPSAKVFTVVDVPSMHFLMIDGHGDPNTARAYQEAVEALYGLAFKIKFVSKRELDKDYVVPPLEGLWWAEDMDTFSSARDKSAWDWTMMIMQPQWITQDIVTESIEQVKEKELPALSRIRLEDYAEGLSVQIMHLGSYDDEGPALARLHSEWIPENGYVENGKHHEIYISDPRRVAPEKLKTVLRQPVRRAR